MRRPGAVALIDPPNKQRVSGELPMQLTYMEADSAISAIASQFIDAGLPPGSIVALQLPNTIEFPIAALAAIRAGMVVALLPQLWRQAELTTALTRIGARAIIGVGRIELVDHGDLMMAAAAEVFSIRHVFGFGKNLPEGMTQLEIATGVASDTRAHAILDPRQPAIVSFDVTADGLCAVPRDHVQMIAGGLTILLESGMSPEANILSTVASSSFGGFASSLVTWLLSGHALALHHAGDLDVLEKQIAGPNIDVLVAPALIALRLAEMGAFSERSRLTHVIALWRTPENASSSDSWPHAKLSFTDVLLFGEIGLIAACRQADGSLASITSGVQSAPRAVAGSRAVGEIAVTPRGTLALRGVMVPLAAYRTSPSNQMFAEQSLQVDTGYAARLNRAAHAVDITAPPGGIVGVGGYRFRSKDLDEWSKRLGDDAMLTALPDKLNGHRLAGRASDTRRVREALSELGLNPLMVEAFRNRADSA